MLNSSQQLPSQGSSSTRRSSTSASSSLSSVINFNYSTDINTPPCLQSSDEDEFDDKLLSALMQDCFDAGMLANAQRNTRPTVADGQEQVSAQNHPKSRFSASMPHSAARTKTLEASMRSAESSFIPRPVYHPQPQQKKMVYNPKSASVDGRLTKDDKSKIDEVDDEQNFPGGSLGVKEQHSPVPPAEALPPAHHRKKYECFLMTGNRMVNKTPQLHFLPHIASAPGLTTRLQSEATNGHHQQLGHDIKREGVENTALSSVRSGGASSSSGNRHEDSPQLVDSAIPTATTTSSFNEDEEATSVGHQRHGRCIGFRASLFRDPSSNSSAAGGDAERNTQNSFVAPAAVATTDDESGIDLAKPAWPANGSLPSKTSSAANNVQISAPNAGIQQHSAETVPATSSHAEPLLSFFTNGDNNNNIFHETDILDTEPEVCKPAESHDVKPPQMQNGSSFEDFVVNLPPNSQKSVVSDAAVPKSPIEQQLAMSTQVEWNNIVVPGCPLPDILNNCRNQQHEQQTSPKLGWNDIESVAGDTIAIIGSGNCGFSAGRPQQILGGMALVVVDEAYAISSAATVKNAETVDDDDVPSSAVQLNRESFDMPSKKLTPYAGQIITQQQIPPNRQHSASSTGKKKVRDDRPVWTFNAPLQIDDHNTSLEQQQQPTSASPAPTGGYGATTRSVPASPATYRRGGTGVAGGGSLSFGGGRRIGRALMMHRGGDGADSTNNYIGSRPHPFVTVMPFLRLKSFDSGSQSYAGAGVVGDSLTPQQQNAVTPSSNDTTLKSLARSLYYLKGCTPVEVADHIVEDAELKRVYLNLHNFSGLNLEIALRQFLEKVCLIGTPQQKADLLERFSRRFYYTYDEEFENWLHRSEIAKIQEDGARSSKLQFSTLSSLPASAGGDDISLSISAYSTTDRQPSNNSTNNKLFVSIRTTFFASLALVLISSHFYQQQLATNSASNHESDRGGEDDDDDKFETSDAGNHHHVRERHAAGSRHPKPGCLDHLPSISAYTVRYDENDDEEAGGPPFKKPARKTSATTSLKDAVGIMSDNKNIPVIIKASNASKLTSTDANGLWHALFNDLLPSDERVPSREQNRLKTSICKEPLPVKLTEDEIELLYQLACRYEPPVENDEADQRPGSSFLGLQNAAAVNDDADSTAATAARDVPLPRANIDDDEALMSGLLSLSDEAENEQRKCAEMADNNNLFVRRVTAASPPIISTATMSVPTHWPPFKLFMESAFGEVLKIKHRCGPQGAHIKWWGRRWHRRLIELRDLMLIERRPSLVRKSINDPKRQRADPEDVVIPLHHAWVERPTAEDYPKHSDNPNVLQLFLHSGAIRMLRCDSEQQAQRWLRMINLNCAFSAPVKVPATNDPTCLLQQQPAGFSTRSAQKDHLISSTRSDIGPYETTVGGARGSAAAGSGTCSTMLMNNYAPPRFFPDAITTFNQHQQLAELRDYCARCEHDARIVADEERELRQTRTLSLHASLRRSARRHTQRLLQQRSGALLMRKQLLATEVRRTRVYIHALEQLTMAGSCVSASGDGNEVVGNTAAAASTNTTVKVVESVTVVKQSIK